MTINLTKLKALAEIERHRLVEAEGCKPEISNRPVGGHTADAPTMHGLDKAEGCKPDLINSPFFYALAGPDGKPHYDDFCVANSPADLECHEDGVTIVPLYTHPAPESVAALREDIARGERIQLAMALDLSAIAQALGIPPEEQQGGAAESLTAIQDLRTQLTAWEALLRKVEAGLSRWVPNACAEEIDLINATLNSSTASSTQTAELTDVLPTAAVEGNQLVIRITTECLLHAVTCSSQWPVNEAGSPISINDGPLLVQEIIHELQREDEQGTNPMHRLFDEAALDALNNGSQAVDYDEVQP